MNEQNLVWVDCEFTGLDFTNDSIIEIAVVVTTPDLEILGTPVQFAIQQPAELLNNAAEWVKEHIPEVVQASRTSTITMQQAEEKILYYITQYTVEGKSPWCGNTVSSDKRMIEKDMPAFANWMFYRVIDVSTLKELAVRWNPAAKDGFVKQKTHHAMDDILESIEELKHYRKTFIK